VNIHGHIFYQEKLIVSENGCSQSRYTEMQFNEVLNFLFGFKTAKSKVDFVIIYDVLWYKPKAKMREAM